MPEIGFLIIGAAKAGTTSLFEYMRAHPQLHMPAEKELYYFNMDRNYRRGWDWYSHTVTRDAPADAICGEGTTEYISGAPYPEHDGDEIPASWRSEAATLEELIPRRIERALPRVKLIAVLRDPVQRAFSHYRMMALGRSESRSFEQAVEDLLQPAAQEPTRALRTRLNGYVVNGEYARLLGGFLRVFPREQLMVVFTKELEEAPEATLANIFEFVGVSPRFIPENAGTRYRTAAVRQRIPGLNLITWQASLARATPARALWHALPDGARGRLDRAYNVTNHRVEMWNAWRGVAEEGIDAHVRERLIAHYRSDSEALADLLGLEIPWLAGWEQPASTAGASG